MSEQPSIGEQFRQMQRDVQVLREKAENFEHRIMGLEWLAGTSHADGVRHQKAMMLLDNIASAQTLNELSAWQAEVRKFLSLPTKEVTGE